MALTPTKNKAKQLSLEFLTPVVKKVSYSQFVNNGDSMLFRSVSCGEIWTPASDGKALKTTQVAYSKYIFPRKRRISEFLDIKDSVHHKRIKSPSMRKENSSSGRIIEKQSIPRIRLFTTMYWLITLVLAIAIYFFSYAKRSWEFAPVKGNLERNLYGQNVAMKNLENAFNLALNAERSALVVFTGSVGVGKSLTASAVLEKFPWPGQAKKASVQQLPDLDLFSLMSIFGWNLLVVEDCSIDIDEKNLKIIDAILNHAKAKDIRLFVILVCTVRGNEEAAALKDLLAPMEPYSMVSFDSLSRDSVKKCFNREILKMRLEIPDQDLERMIDEQMRPIKQVGGPPGCKQVAMKLIEFIDDADDQ